MRTIKFRGRNEKGEWFYGGFAYQHFADEYDNGQPTQGFTTVAAIFNDEPGNRNGSYWHTVAEHTVGQYTGLKDADGKEIYENDILEVGGEMYAKVVWNKEKASFEYEYLHPTQIANTFYEFNMPYLSIIGNIHDNPELL